MFSGPIHDRYRVELIAMNNPIQPYLDSRGVLVLDGGLASELERAGFDLDDPLWSAKMLLESPEAVSDVHRSYLEVGADCIISASYQATIEGFRVRGLSVAAAEEAIRKSVQLAIDARDAFWADEGETGDRLRPLVAASVGPYGAYLADGSEFTGVYGLDEQSLLDFHRRRWKILASTEADLLACETIPSLREARALARLLTETPGRWAWFSFSCRDGEHISDGTPIVDCVRALAAVPRVAAIGVNCTAPIFIPSLVENIHSVTGSPIVVYPNSGEGWDADNKCWIGTADPVHFAAAGVLWRNAGARLIGGCCRTGPEDIRQLREALDALS
jgi:homocysteine S-methyltransferase